MSDVIDIEEASSKKKTRSKSEAKRIAIQKKKQEREQLEFQLLNMRQMYEGEVQNKAALENAIGELRTIIGAIMVACEKDVLEVTEDHLSLLNAKYEGYEMNVVGEGQLLIEMIEKEDE